MIRTLCVAALVVIFTPAVLRAQDAPLSCDDGRTQLNANQCAVAELARADSVLNAVYWQVAARMDSTQVPLLRQAQRGWIQLRDADCALENKDVKGGSIHAMLYAMCLGHQTRLRTAHLRQLLASHPEAPDDRSAVIIATSALFTAMQGKDTAALRTLMHPRAQIIAVRDGRVSVRSVDEWIGGLGQTAGELIERMWDPRVEVDGDLATLWAPYDFHVGERFSHCGTDAFQFVRVAGAWKMITVTFTGRTTGCQGAP
jgi:uncharacterized protein YecT (DUF1311 family)